MKLNIMLSAVALAACAGSAFAQGNTVTAPVPAAPSAGAGFNNGFNNGTGFNNGAGFNNGTGFNNGANPGFGGTANGGFGTGFNNGFGYGLGVDPYTGQPITSAAGSGFFNGFNPGFAFGPAYGGYGGYYSPYGFGGAVNLTPTPYGSLNAGGAAPGFGRGGGRLPVLGLNVPSTAIPRAPRARVRQLTPTNNERLVDTPDGVAVTNPADPTPNNLGARGTGDRTAGNTNDATPRDFGAVAAASNMMASDRPLRGGRLMRVNGEDATVEFSVNGVNRTASVPLAEVFYFRPNGEMTTLAQAPSGIRAGGSIMVADPYQPLNPARVRQSVAGSRQEYYTNGVRVTNTVTKRHTTKKHTRKSRTHRTR